MANDNRGIDLRTDRAKLLHDILLRELSERLDVFSKRFREDDETGPDVYIVDSSDFDPAALAVAIDNALNF